MTAPAVPEPTRSAVVVVVTEAEPVVSRHRRRLDRAAGWGVPAHVTVVYPFVPPADVDDDVLARLAAAVASVPAFSCTLARTAWFGEEVVYLAPEPAGPFRALTRAVEDAFPAYPAYGGQFAEPVPHLTLAHLGTLGDRRAAEAAVALLLPVTASVDRVTLLTGSEEPDSWRVAHEMPLG